MPEPRENQQDFSEIKASRVSVFEVELDLRHWGVRLTNEVPGFAAALGAALPTTRDHKCMSGKHGGFHEELYKGTSFGHVIEHVLLELIHLAAAGDRSYSGWTKELGYGVYVIHHGAPDFLTGRLAAVMAVDLVKRLVHGQRVDVEHCVSQLRDPLAALAREVEEGGLGPEIVEPLSAIDETEGQDNTLEMKPVSWLAPEQEERLTQLWCDKRDRLTLITRLWRRAFFAYAGEFGRSIVDKIELLNPDTYVDLINAAGFGAYFRSLRNASGVISSYRIPLSFVVHACWLYKNHLALFALYELMEEPEDLRLVIGDIRDLYAIVAREVAAGFASQERALRSSGMQDVRGFRELRKSARAIVIADDDEMSRRAIRDILEFNGYRTLSVEDGYQALATIAKMRGRIGLVVLDVALPGLGGSEVCERVKTLYPEIHIILASDFPLERSLSACLLDDSVRFLSKPFLSEDLLGHVRAAFALGGETLRGAPGDHPAQSAAQAE